MTRSEMQERGLKPFTTMFTNIMDVGDIMVYNDKRRGKSDRRIKICSCYFRPSTSRLILLKKEVLKYNYKLLSHETFGSEYVFHFKEFKSLNQKIIDFYLFR